jgi:hypothetical protein
MIQSPFLSKGVFISFNTRLALPRSRRNAGIGKAARIPV